MYHYHIYRLSFSHVHELKSFVPHFTGSWQMRKVKPFRGVSPKNGNNEAGTAFPLAE
jgi:hypothetical protein